MLRNRQEKEEALIRGVNLLAHPLKLQLGYFTSLANWIPSKKYKIKKKRGVATFASAFSPPLSFTPPVINEPSGCGISATKSLAMECTHICAGQFAEATFTSDPTDHTIAGPAIRVKSNSSTSAFYGLAAVYDRDNTNIHLGFWDFQTLDTIATIVGTSNTTLQTGDVLRIEGSNDAPSTFNVRVNGGIVITYVDSLEVVDVTASCIGWISVSAVS